MRWITDAKGQPINYIGYAEKTSTADAVAELWHKYINDAAPKNAELPWDYLGVYIYIDSGRIILFPVVKTSRYRIEKAMCQIICPDLLASYEDMIEAGVSDNEFDVWANQAIEKVANLVSKAAKEARLPEQLGCREVRILYYSYGGDSEPIKEDVLKRSELRHANQ